MRTVQRIARDLVLGIGKRDQVPAYFLWNARLNVMTTIQPKKKNPNARMIRKPILSSSAITAIHKVQIAKIDAPIAEITC